VRRVDESVDLTDKGAKLVHFGLEDGGTRQLDGWTNEQRARNLQLVVNNSRFLILPWAGAESGEHYSLFVRAATTRRLEARLRLSPAAFGDAGRLAVSRH